MAGVPHFRLVYPEHEGKGVLRTSRNVKIFVTFPGQEEFELSRLLTNVVVSANLGIDRPDKVTLELLGTFEVQYGD